MTPSPPTAAARSVPATAAGASAPANFPQNRVSDHRIELTLYRLDAVMNGDLDLLIEPLLAHEQAEKLQNREYPEL